MCAPAQLIMKAWKFETCFGNCQWLWWIMWDLYTFQLRIWTNKVHQTKLGMNEREREQRTKTKITKLPKRPPACFSKYKLCPTTFLFRFSSTHKLFVFFNSNTLNSISFHNYRLLIPSQFRCGRKWQFKSNFETGLGSCVFLSPWNNWKKKFNQWNELWPFLKLAAINWWCIHFGVNMVVRL